MLVIALVALVGAGFGCFADDLCPAGASYADDPAVPAPAGSLVMASVAVDPFAAPMQAMDMSRSPLPPAPPRIRSAAHTPPAAQPPSPSLATPRRC